MKCSLVLGLFLVILATASAQKKVVCYWGSWSGGLPASNIDTTICTHIIYSFVGVSADGRITEVNQDPVNDMSLRNFALIKSKNPQVKLMVAAGGWTFGTAIFKTLAASPTARSELAKNAVIFLKNYNLDGFDVDWEYPIGDKENFILLLTDLKRQLSANNLLLTVAVAAGQDTSDKAYDIPRIQAQVDFINLMTYDLHQPWEGKTGHNAPLFDDPISVDSCVQYWLLRGTPRDKLILGIPSYGQLFTLADPKNNWYGAPTVGGTTRTYSEICNTDWQRTWLESKQVPIKINGNQWLGYDDIQSVSIKAQYAKNQNLGGVMLWSLENDDFAGSCRQGTFPITRTIFGITMENTAPIISPVTVPTIGTSPPVVTVPTTTNGFRCPTATGLFADPSDTSKYYSCANFVAFPMQCGGGLIWNNPKQWCDFPSNVAPTIATIKPTIVTVKPTIATIKPTIATIKPTIATVKPTIATVKPTIATAKPTIATAKPTIATVKPTIATVKPIVIQTFQCPTPNGLFADPASCFKYYNCGNGFPYSMNCGDGLKWNSAGQYCDFAQNVQC